MWNQGIHHNLGHYWQAAPCQPFVFSLICLVFLREKKKPKWTDTDQRLQQYFPDCMRTFFVTHCCCWVKSQGWSPLPVDTRDRPSCWGMFLWANGTYEAAPFSLWQKKLISPAAVRWSTVWGNGRGRILVKVSVFLPPVHRMEKWWHFLISPSFDFHLDTWYGSARWTQECNAVVQRIPRASLPQHVGMDE